MNLDRVTITGADDSIRPADLIPLTWRFPFVEWGILLSRKQEGNPRFPSLKWIEELWDIRKRLAPVVFNLSGHLCGSWVRDIVRGRFTFETERPSIALLFQRMQLNFHGENFENIDINAFGEVLANFDNPCEYIFQMDGVNDDLGRGICATGVSIDPLFDVSGGAGVLAKRWPYPLGPYCGYAGGLAPENLQEQLLLIKTAADYGSFEGENQRIWIDVETKVRSNNDRQFDLDKVTEFLEIAEPWVKKSAMV